MGYVLPAPGDLIADKYVVEYPLGQGGMGVVYAVRHRITEKRLALKCLLPERAENPRIAARFLREAQAAGRIQHRHVVDVFDAGADHGLSFIVMELLDGIPLSQLLHDASLTLAEGLDIILRAMEGVAAAHARGVIHRDLKPDNIVVCTGTTGRLDDPRVLDFGISKFEDGFSPLTSTGGPIGTPYYMSLEQLRGERDLDARVDVYAMGIVLYEAIAGRRPYMAENVSVLAIQVMTAEPIPLSTLHPELPPGLCEVVMKAIARDRADRYRSMRALIEALAPFAAEARRQPAEARTPLRTAPRSDGAAGVTTASAQPLPGQAHSAHAEQLASSSSAQPLGVADSAAPGDAAKTSPARTRRAVWIAASTALLLIGAGLAWYLRPDASSLLVVPTGSLTPRELTPAISPTQALATTPADAKAPVRAEPEDDSSTLPTPSARSPRAARRGSRQDATTPTPSSRGPTAAPMAAAPDEAAASPLPVTPMAPVRGRTGETMVLDEF